MGTRTTVTVSMLCLLSLGVLGAGCPALETTPDAELQEQVRARWNLVAEAAPEPRGVVWSTLEEFPHPTYRFGTPAAYTAFAHVLADFLEVKANFDFLASDRLFYRMPLLYRFPGGQLGLDTSFAEVTRDMAEAQGLVHPDLLPRLRQLRDAIHALP